MGGCRSFPGGEHQRPWASPRFHTAQELQVFDENEGRQATFREGSRWCSCRLTISQGSLRSSEELSIEVGYT